MGALDLIVIGGGISGCGLAARAAHSGRNVAIVESSERLGGCLNTHRTAAGFWLEIGAHTCYNSYTAFAEMLDSLDLKRDVLPRIPTKLRFLDGDTLVPGHNLGALIRVLSLGELTLSFPRILWAKKTGQSIAAYYSRIVGTRNFKRVLSPLLSAVPSQQADAIPADMLFKSREHRRKDYPRSFTLRGGLATVIENISRRPHVDVLLGRNARSISREQGRFLVTLDDGTRLEAPRLALAVPPSSASSLLSTIEPAIARAAAEIREVQVESIGVVIRADRVSLPVSMFLVPLAGGFYSAVSRDPVPDPAWRGFAFHFGPGGRLEERLQVICRALKISNQDIEDRVESQVRLPSPVLGHHELIRQIDDRLAGKPLALVGNWFDGLAIEDCMQRSLREWNRIAAAG